MGRVDSMIHTCPRCELRFLTHTELQDHLRADHHVDTTQFEPFHYRPLEERPPTKRYLVVGNQTLGEPGVLDRIAELTKDGHVHLVVPTTSPEPGSERVDEQALALASFRMRRAVDVLHEREIDAEGEVGHFDPVRAIAHALEHEQADEVILSTLPKGVSKWLQVDLPTAIEHRFGLAVTVITASTDVRQ